MTLMLVISLVVFGLFCFSVGALIGGINCLLSEKKDGN